MPGIRREQETGESNRRLPTASTAWMVVPRPALRMYSAQPLRVPVVPTASTRWSTSPFSSSAISRIVVRCARELRGLEYCLGLKAPGIRSSSSATRRSRCGSSSPVSGSGRVTTSTSAP